FFSFHKNLVVNFFKLMQVNQGDWQYICITLFDNSNVSEHLSYHDFYVFITDFNPLHAVYALYFTQQVGLNTVDTLYLQQFFRVNGTFIKFLSSFNLISNRYCKTCIIRHSVTNTFGIIFDDNFSFVFAFFYFLNSSSKFTNNCLPFRVSSFKQFLNSRQPLCNVISSNSTCVECTHCKLCTRFTN